MGSDCGCGGYLWSMLKRVEIEVDDDLIQKVIRRYRVKGAREAVNLALRTLLGEADTAEHGHDDEYDEFSDPNAWVPRRSRDTG
ncbi:type II toxin-antitoxin system VapB family antitoxin [Mycobacterium tuberculosis]|uniref:Uncharacterized protein Rv0634A n=15 Tax=Mycobacterium tuberculosis complex TaxID=77643 RepID=Y634A_MYCTU|nr:type II toxin-antitoxin system VapB family antitoxin [Mycobacterium tuberculosis]YP_177629.1 hypothetical protein Rv0634A [Mycobacterium tuberculosis H37Rv]P9WKS4.1 RecName: Full=Uncharacterized protein MT0662.1 [Mycobacterium tuberculosis CDC1551]P9WKS5.1 RecName: Full=Uncharacterized protein Rv0634A [Mycobacterium tuberculosis H37Rv]ABQ72368.1 hypothetical protein MRA_0644 [Mycobacterium tuberculosis H37Ra]ABR04989.1 hypothetical protein TBFG_10646 [Mycobacterium tuberculosis F11]ACT2367